MTPRLRGLLVVGAVALVGCFPDPPAPKDTSTIDSDDVAETSDVGAGDVDAQEDAADGERDTLIATEVDASDGASDGELPEVGLPDATSETADSGDSESDMDATGPLCTAESCAVLDGVCTLGVCTETGCISEARVGSCDDGNPCTSSDKCTGETCGGTAAVCDDGLACTADRCDPGAGGCVADAVGCDCDSDEDCADATLCDGSERCVNQECVEGTAVVCSPSSDPCLVATCAPVTGICGLVPAPGTPSCNDGKFCTQNDRCADGVCNGAQIGCDDFLDCSIDGCTEVAGGCFHDKSQCECLQDSDCQDGTLCNGGETCLLGDCMPGDPVECPETPDPCTTRLCQAATGLCSIEGLSGGSCDDAKVCTDGDVCQNGLCKGQSLTCAQPDWCKSYQCFEPAGCDVALDSCECDIDADCIDVDRCDGTQRCIDHACVEQNPVTCPASANPCKDNICKPATGACELANKDNTTVCDDGLQCTLNDKCSNGTCGGTAKICDDGIACSLDSCSASTGQCVFNTTSCGCLNASDCNDGNDCNGIETCDGTNTCKSGTPVTCSASANPCKENTCDISLGQCTLKDRSSATTCDDGIACTTNDHCGSGATAGQCAGTTVTCAATGNACSENTCDPALGICTVKNLAATTVCNDGNACTQTDRCGSGATAGQCAGVQITCGASGNACQSNTCVPADGAYACTLKPMPTTTTCNDNNACTQTDKCGSGGTSGQCVGTNPYVCPATDQCHDAGVCNPLSAPSPACNYASKADATLCSDALGVDAVANDLGTCSTGTCRRLPIVRAGESHTCALLWDGSVKCWGSNAYGQLGLGNTTNVGDGVGPTVAAAANVFSSGIVDLSAGIGVPGAIASTCAIKNSSGTYTAHCWGSANFLGYPDNNQRGHTAGTKASVLPAIALGANFSPRTISAGGVHTCVLSNLGKVRCFGLGDYISFGGPAENYGSLGYPGTISVNQAGGVLLSALGDISVDGSASTVLVDAGARLSCALLSSQKVRCWGMRFGTGYAASQDTGNDENPSSGGLVSGAWLATSLDASFDFGCAVTTTGSTYCWGSNGSGQLGRNSVTTDYLPQLVALGTATAVTQVSTGFFHTCAVLTNGKIRCWGLGARGQLGTGTTANVGDSAARPISGDVSLNGTAVQVAAGFAHTCAVMRDGKILCWGEGDGGRLGSNSTNDIGDGPGEMPPVPVQF